MFADGREQLQSHVVRGSLRTGTRAKWACFCQQHNGAGLAQSRQPAPPLLVSVIEYAFRSTPRNWRTKLECFFPPPTLLLLHQKWGLRLYVCSSSSVVKFSIFGLRKGMKFFIFTCATSLLFTVLSLFLVEEAAMLMLETEGCLFPKDTGRAICSWLRITVLLFFCGRRPWGHIRTSFTSVCPHAGWSPFPIKNLGNSVLRL